MNFSWCDVFLTSCAFKRFLRGRSFTGFLLSAITTNCCRLFLEDLRGRYVRVLLLLRQSPGKLRQWLQQCRIVSRRSSTSCALLYFYLVVAMRSSFLPRQQERWLVAPTAESVVELHCY